MKIKTDISDDALGSGTIFTEKNLVPEKGHGNDAAADKPDRPDSKKQKCREGWTRLDETVQGLAEPINRLTVSTGCESFLPLPLDQECRKAARIITGLSAYMPSPPDQEQTNTRPDSSSYATYPPAQPTITIPASAIAESLGILILTTLRLGFGRTTVSTGSGLLIARRPDDSNGKWGLPVAVRAHSLGGGPMALGVGVADRVYVINTAEALRDLQTNKSFVVDAEGVVALGGTGGGAGLAFVMAGKAGDKKMKKKRCCWWCRHTTDEHSTAEPRSSSVIDEKEGLHEPSHKNGKDKKSSLFKEMQASARRPVHCYMRCRGLYAGFQAQAAAVLQREDANESFYGGKYSVEKILAGDVHPGEGSDWEASVEVLVNALERAGRLPSAGDGTVRER